MRILLFAITLSLLSSTIFAFEYQVKVVGKVTDYKAEPIAKELKLCAKLKALVDQKEKELSNCLKTNSDEFGIIQATINFKEKKDDKKEIKIIPESLTLLYQNSRSSTLYIPVKSLVPAVITSLNKSNGSVIAYAEIPGDTTERRLIFSQQVEYDYPVSISGEVQTARIGNFEPTPQKIIAQLCAEVAITQKKDNKVKRETFLHRCKKISLSGGSFSTKLNLNRYPGKINPARYGKAEISEPSIVNLYIKTSDKTYGFVRKFPLLIRKYSADALSSDIEADIILK